MFTFGELSQWTSTQWTQESELGLSTECSIVHDTRTLKAGDVYLAIRGDVHDGHAFVEQAIVQGAAGLIVEREFPELNIPQLIVPDAMDALWQMAAGFRATWAGAVIGITGSVGKTTVKELLASVLSQQGVVSKTRGNWNNDIGLPLSMLAADRASNFFVFELGMNHPGEIYPLAELLKPEWAVITNAGKAHTEHFSGVSAIADEKAAILRHAKYAILNPDSEWFERWRSGFYGIVVPMTSQAFISPQPGAHMALNLRFAATLALQLGLSPEAIQAGLDAFVPAAMRWERTEQDGVVFINDAYNANPISMRAAITTFAELQCEGRRFLVLGGMRELGEATEIEHRALGEFVDSLDFDRVLTVGELGQAIACRGELGLQKPQVVERLRSELQPGDHVLLKASRGVRLETVLNDLI